MGAKGVARPVVTTPQDFVQAYPQALATQDWAVVGPLIHEGACVTFSGGESFYGKAAVRRAFERNFALIRSEVYVISDVHLGLQAADFAVHTFAFEWSGLIQDKRAAGSGRGTAVIVKEDGTWLLLAEHLGPAPK